MSTFAETPLAKVAPAAERPQVRWRNLEVGALMNLIQVTTLGQPLEVLKTHVAANRKDSLAFSIRKTWARGGIRGFYQGLIPWAWIEASTKGSILILTSTEVEYYAKTKLRTGNELAGVLAGVAGGAAQAYLTMGVTTCMKTIEVTRSKNLQSGATVKGTMATFVEILKTKGILGVNRGVNAVALRQITGWSSRIGISRVAETQIRNITGKPQGEQLSFGQKILASTVGGTLSCWNQPFEVMRIEMQSLTNDPDRPQKLTMVSTAKHIINTSGFSGFFRGVVPRIGVASWATICMVGLGDIVKDKLGTKV
ncbi:mitochondrial carrier [Xylaria cf. heliscus]|nr:mitochondrial carrier [Xylaria cf. heliscus]